MSLNPNITYYLCGGTGINIGKAIKAQARSNANKAATFVGLDSSGANSPGDAFPVEYITVASAGDQKARGSGKDKAANYEKAPAFVAAALAKHEPSSFNIIVCNTAGGTGSMLGTLVLRAIAKQNLPVFMMFISDFTSTAEMENAVGTLRSNANQVLPNQLNRPVCFIHEKNTADKTRGEVNTRVVDRLDLVSLFFTEENEEMDYADSCNFLNYSYKGTVPPAFSEVSFYDQNSYETFEGKTPVAVASLFATSDEIVPVFEGTSYRTTGVFGANTKRPDKLTQLHMVLDHGEALAKLEADMKELAGRQATRTNNFVTQKPLGEDANDNGMIL